MLHFFNADFPEDHAFKNITPIADDGDISLKPEMYMLGSSNGGVQFAIEEVMGFVFASHIFPHLAIPVLRKYHNEFKPSSNNSGPKGIFSTILITAETDEEAEYLAGPVELFWARLQTGNIHASFSTLEEAANHKYSAAEQAAREQNKDRFIIGGIDTVSEKLKGIAEEAMVDEIMIMEAYSDKKASHKGLRLLAEEFNL